MIAMYFTLGLVVVLTFAGVLPALVGLLWQLFFNPIGYVISEND